MATKRQRTLLKVVVVGLLLTSPCWLSISGLIAFRTYQSYFVYTAEDRARVGPGLPSDARKWKAELEQINNPDQIDPASGIVVKKFISGEWVIGRCSDSHDWGHRGGTIVIRDSRGAVHAYFGHVDGVDALRDNLEKFYYLDELYAAIDQELQGVYPSSSSKRFYLPLMVEWKVAPNLGSK